MASPFPDRPFEPSPEFREWLDRLVGNGPPPKPTPIPEDPDE
jgi:hypothetical protein